MSGSITARIQCTVEMVVGEWGGGKSVDTDALIEQVRREGVSKLSSVMKDNGGRVIGVPVVQLVLLDAKGGAS